MDREACSAAIHGVAKSRTWLSNWTELNWTDKFQRMFTLYGKGLPVCLLYLFCLLLTFSDIIDSLNDSEIKWIATQFFWLHKSLPIFYFFKHKYFLLHKNYWVPIIHCSRYNWVFTEFLGWCRRLVCKWTWDIWCVSTCMPICFGRYLTLCNPMGCSPPGSSVCGILQAWVLEWVVMPSSRGSSGPRDQTQVSYVSCIGRRVLSTSTTWGSLQP